MHAKYLAYMAYMPSLVGKYVSGIYMAVTSVVEFPVGCFDIGMLEAHIVYFPCKQFLKCGSHICSVIYIKDVNSAPC